MLKPSVTFLCNKEISKNLNKLVKIVNIEKENLLKDLKYFNKISRKDVVYYKIKLTKKQGFTLPLQSKFLEKPQWGVKLPNSHPPLSPAF